MKHLPLAFLVAVAPVAGPTTALAGDDFWGCNSGYSFEVRGSAARCFKPARTQTSAVESCLPGQTYRQDFQGASDMCVTGVGVGSASFPPACKAGTRLETRRGTDQCVKKIPAAVQAPTRKVNI